MIIIKLKGGLGNQLFQYTLGRSLEFVHHKQVKFDLSWFDKFPQRKYNLSNFNTKVDIATKIEIIMLREWKMKKDGRRYFPLNLFRKKHALHIEENYYHYQDKILEVRNNTYLDGNWQSEKYFKNIENIIRKEITLKEKVNENLKRNMQEIKECNSVSLHIRRGDYTTVKVQCILKLCSPEYYNQAIEFVKNKTKKPTFFIFSDDMEWVRNNIETHTPTIFVSDGNLKDYEELILMSRCKHNIIANSSFSWWGAWLNDNQNKIVIAPKKWFKDTSKNTKDLIPESWIKL
ncbi:MAG TPA: alpha-1,2-fucosyltransferase [Ignavibacteria bacterium]|nr:alpha-1,2-fucosyltransferase [Ignavibacteria bacterium]